MNLIPETPGNAPNYWCTWNLQEAIANKSEGKLNIRNVLCEDFLLGEKGWAKTMFPQIRKDLYLLFDDGWDIALIPGNDPLIAKEIMRQNLSSFILDSEKWPSLSGDPASRLLQINQKIQQVGWRGIGLWVAAQEAAKYKKTRGLFPRSYWQERIEWSQKAAINYWKVDWGPKSFFSWFRQRLTQLAKKFAPQLIIEHAPVTGAFNRKEGNGRVSFEFLHRSKKFLNYSDVLRLYDVCFDLGKATMLDRLAGVLQHLPQEHKGAQLLHTEDELYLAAAIGCTMGIMRHPLWGPNVKMQEVVRAIRWHRIAPPFGASATPSYIQNRILFDSHYFPNGSFWDRHVWNKTIQQGAPACISRGMPNPKIMDAQEHSASEIPFIVAAQNPNGAVSIATLGRVDPQKGYYTPRIAVNCPILSWNRPIGIFGEFSKLILESPAELKKGRIWAQDLASHTAEDITSQVQQSPHSLELSGELIHRIGTLTNPENDPSEPALILKIEDFE